MMLRPFVSSTLNRNRSQEDLSRLNATTQRAPRRTPSVPPAGDAAAGTASRTRRSSRRSYPEALPSPLSTKYDGPVTGTAIIDKDSAAIAALVEMVTPDATPLLEPLTQEYLEDCRVEMEAHCRHLLARGQTGYDSEGLRDSFSNSLENSEAAEGAEEAEDAAGPRRGRAGLEERRQHTRSRSASRGFRSMPSPDRGTFANSFRATPNPLPRSHVQSRNPGSQAAPGEGTAGSGGRSHRSPRVLREGGYVVFTDEYLQTHPGSPVASITREYQLVNPPPVPPVPPDPALDEKKRKVEEIKRVIKEAEMQHRPLFRRRPAEVVYGEARYLPRTDEDTDLRPVASLRSSLVMSQGTAESTSVQRAATEGSNPPSDPA